MDGWRRWPPPCVTSNASDQLLAGGPGCTPGGPSGTRPVRAHDAPESAPLRCEVGTFKGSAFAILTTLKAGFRRQLDGLREVRRLRQLGGHDQMLSHFQNPNLFQGVSPSRKRLRRPIEICRNGHPQIALVDQVKPGDQCSHSLRIAQGDRHAGPCALRQRLPECHPQASGEATSHRTTDAWGRGTPGEWQPCHARPPPPRRPPLRRTPVATPPRSAVAASKTTTMPSSSARVPLPTDAPRKRIRLLVPLRIRDQGPLMRTASGSGLEPK